MTLHTHYTEAYNAAVDEARKFSRIMQLRKISEYGKVRFIVQFAVQEPSKRFGVDAQGEFINPTDPKV